MRDIEELARIAVDCGFQVHSTFGPGLLETVYEAVLADELASRGLKVDRQMPVDIHYKGRVLREGFRIDILVEDQLIIELKSAEQTAPVFTKQVLTYLRLTDRTVGLLMNFGTELFRQGVKRVVNRHPETQRLGPSRFRAFA